MSHTTPSLTRRSFLATTGAAAAALATPTITAHAQASPGPGAALLDILRPPDHVTAFAGLKRPMRLARSASRWQGPNGVSVEAEPRANEVSIRVTSPEENLTHIHLRWLAPVAPSLLFLGDHWERSYGDLAWRSLVPERVLPWYFATWDGSRLHAYGVRTGGRALCFWQTDGEGVSLWLNIANGGNGVELGQRTLDAATVISRAGQPGETPHAALAAFCRQMSPHPRLPKDVVYGSNDWYYAYGNSSEQLILEDADMMASLAPAGAPRPFVIMDEGWEQGPPKFPDMSAIAGKIRARGSRAGIWVRPLRPPKNPDPALLMPAARFGEHVGRNPELAWDPTHPDAAERIAAQMRQLAGWGFELIKHDFSTYDMLGQWGFQMGAQPSHPRWSFHDRTRTNAEIISDLYQLIRKNAGEQTIILGCNVVGHLSAGIFEMQRTGDDTSGREWERTRRMGINTIAFRQPQHRAFFLQDPDCVAITRDVAWDETRQWLDLVARSGTTLIVSVEKSALGDEQRQALKAAFATAVSSGPFIQPEDWLASTTPENWMTMPESRAAHRYHWCGEEGASPFPG